MGYSNIPLDDTGLLVSFLRAVRVAKKYLRLRLNVKLYITVY